MSLDHSGRGFGILNRSEPNALGKNLLRDLGAHVSVRRLRLDEHTGHLTLLVVDVGDAELGLSGEDFELLVTLFFKEILASSIRDCRQTDSIVITCSGTATLGVEEKASAVAWHGEITLESEAGLYFVAVSFSDQIFDGEEERHTLAARELDS